MRFESLAQYHDANRQTFGQECIACGECLRECYAFATNPYLDGDPPATMKKVVEVLKEFRYSRRAYEMAFSCTCCGLCYDRCPVGLPVASLMITTAITLVGMGYQPPGRLYQLAPCQPYNFVNLMSLLQMETGAERWVTEVPSNPEPTDVVVFTGCQAFALPHGILSFINILNSMKIDFVTLGGPQFCCGSLYRPLGELTNVERKCRELVDTISAFKPRLTAFVCVGCDDKYRNQFNNFLDIPFKHQHIRIFLADNLEKLSFTTRIEKTVTIYDSCGSRLTNDYESIRKLLKVVPGLKILEMEHTREKALCCGGYVNYSMPERTEHNRRRILDEAMATGAEMLVCVCPTCYMTLCPQERHYPFEIVYYPVLLAKALGFNYPDRYKELVIHGSAERILAENRENLRRAGLDLAEVAWRLPFYLGQWRRKVCNGDNIGIVKRR